MAFSKEHKSEIVAQYVDWFSKSQAVYTLSYAKMSMKDIDTLRVKVRDAGGEIHVIKKQLMKLALDELGVSNQDTFEGLTIAGFAFSDAPL